jgi:phosphotransferase system IIB component
MFHIAVLSRNVSIIFITLVLTAAVAAESHAAMDTTKIEQITGLKGTFSKGENVFKISKPRTDIKVQVDNWQVPPFMGLTSWVAFTPAHDAQLMAMGDLVLFEDEVNPVMSVALDAGLEVTALHNHFFFDQPKVYFMHIGGMGNIDDLAGDVKKVFDEVNTIRKARPTPANEFPGNQIGRVNSITAAPLEAVFGTKGQSSNGMFKIVIGRSVTMHGVSLGKEMGVNTWAGFAGSDDQAVVDGDFAVLEDELQPVLKAMRAGGINIVAIHQHMSLAQPHYLFLHYWGKGKAGDLAKVIHRTLDFQEK